MVVVMIGVTKSRKHRCYLTALLLAAREVGAGLANLRGVAGGENREVRAERAGGDDPIVLLLVSIIQLCGRICLRDEEVLIVRKPVVVRRPPGIVNSLGVFGCTL